MLGSGSRAFDLQGIPAGNRRLFQESAEFTIVDDGNERLHDLWARSAAQDAVLGHDLSLVRRFLWSFGPDFREGRRAFRGLCETLGAMSGPTGRTSAAATYDCIATFFDKSDERIRVTQAIFGGPPSPWAIAEPEALEVVVRDTRKIIEESPARLRERAKALPLGDLEKLFLHLTEEGRSERGRVVAEVFFESCEGASVSRLSVDVATEVLRRRPELGRDTAVWQRPESEALVVVNNLIASHGFNDSVAYGLLSFGNLRLLYEARHAPSRAWVRGAHAYADEHQPPKDVEAFILGRLLHSQEEVRAELHAGRFGQFLKLAAAVLEVSKREAEEFPLSNGDLRSELRRLHDSEAELQANAFLLMVGLVRKDTVAARFVGEGFTPVYLAAREQKLPWDLWSRLESLLPWHFLEWDRCARLVEGVVIRFVDRSWPPRDFFRAFCTDEEFDRAVTVLVSMRQRELLERLRFEVDAVAGTASAFQSRRLSLSLE